MDKTCVAVVERTFASIFCRFDPEGWRASIGLPLETVYWASELANVSLHNLLLTLNWCKEYRHEAASCLEFDMDQQHYGKKLWDTLNKLDRCLPEVI